MLIIIILTAYLASPYLIDNKAFACSCIQRTPTELVDSASAVFSGRVAKVEQIPFGGERTTFDVNRLWKGIETDRIVVWTADPDGNTCGYAFQEGKEYLVYTQGDNLEVGACSGTKLLETAGEDLDALGPGKEVKVVIFRDPDAVRPKSFSVQDIVYIIPALAGLATGIALAVIRPKPRRWFFFAGIMIIFVVVGIALIIPYRPAFPQTDKPGINLDRVEYAEADSTAETVFLHVFFDVSNPNYGRIDLGRIDYELSANGRLLGNSTLAPTEGIAINGKWILWPGPNTKEVLFVFQMNSTDVDEEMLQAIRDNAPITWNAAGCAIVGYGSPVDILGPENQVCFSSYKSP